MRIYNWQRARNFIRKHPQTRKQLLAWKRLLLGVKWTHFSDLKRDFGHRADLYEDDWWIFDVANNEVRVIAIVEFDDKQVWIRHVLTHAEYDQEKWKEDKRLSDKARQAKKSSDKKHE